MEDVNAIFGDFFFSSQLKMQSLKIFALGKLRQHLTNVGGGNF